MEEIWEKHIKEHIYEMSTTVFRSRCEHCGDFVMVRLIDAGYSSFDDNGKRDKMYNVEHRCSRYNFLWNRKHTHSINGRYTHQDILNTIYKKISLEGYKKLIKGEWIFATINYT